MSTSTHKPFLGIALMTASAGVLAAKDGLAKSFLDQIGPLQMIWFQYAGNFLVMALIAMPWHGRDVLRPRPVWGQFARGTVSALGVCCFYWSLTYIPLADGTAMFMVAPIIVALLAPALLGERLDAQRMLAAAVGFAGVVVILKPGFGGNAVGYWIGLLSGVLLALYQIANRILAGSAPPLLNVVNNGLTGALVLTPLLPFFWVDPQPAAVPKIIVLVLLAVIGQGLMITAFMYAPAAVIAPYSYAMLVFAAIIGYVFFDAFPDMATLIGIALIVASGLYIAHRERQLMAVRARGDAT